LGVWFAGLITVLVMLITPLNTWMSLLVWAGIAGGQCALQSATEASR